MLAAAGTGSAVFQHVADVTLGIDRIEAQARPQLLAKLADVTLDNALFDLFVAEAVDEAEDLFLGDAFVLVSHQVLKNSALAARQHEGLAVHFRVASIEEDAHRPDDPAIVGLAAGPALDGAGPGDDFADVHRLPDDVIDADGKQIQRLLEAGNVAEGNQRSAASLTDDFRHRLTIFATAQQKALNG